MSTKREERKQRAEAERVSQERRQRQQKWKSRALVAAGVLALLALVFLTTRHRDGEESNGRVWSAAHGHWHDKNGLAH
jgi:hypothetical protein